MANHKTPLDPFIISIAFPWLSPVYPIRFMAEFKKFQIPKIEFLRKIGVIYIIYFMFGAFSSRRGQGIERALALPKKFLNNNQSVLIFPEGSMIQGNELGAIQRGAGILASETGETVLPVALNYRRGIYVLRVGKMFTVAKHATEHESMLAIQNALTLLFQSISRIKENKPLVTTNNSRYL